MLNFYEKLAFVALAALSLGYAWTGFRKVFLAIARGKPGYYPTTDELPKRIWAAWVRSLSQVTVFKTRPVVSLFHGFIFYGFVFYLLVNLTDVAEGFLPPKAWDGFRESDPGKWFALAADVLGLFILLGVVALFFRRFARNDPALQRFNEAVLLHPGVRDGGIRRDSLIVSLFIFFHVGMRLFGSACRIAEHGGSDPWQPTASVLASLIGSGAHRTLGWHVGWWGALGLVLVFLPYFPRSKHLHIFAAPLRFILESRTEDGRKLPTGALEPVNLADESATQFGVAALEELRRAQLLDPYACIQCNRCTNVCPAHVTGKALAPSAIEINKRYELNAIRGGFSTGEPSPRPMMEFALSESALWACTSCGACVEICPVGCEQLSDIIDLRRDAVMTRGDFPQHLASAFRNMERTQNPWGLPLGTRTDWRPSPTEAPTVEENPNFEILYWVGCAAAFDPIAQKTARSFVEILNHAGVNFAILGNREKCTGDAARRAGNEFLFQTLAGENVETLNRTVAAAGTAPKRIVTACPHCLNALANDYPQYGGRYSVAHHSEFIAELISEGKLPKTVLGETVTYHDPCYLGRHNGIYDPPRRVLAGEEGPSLLEMPRHGRNSFCCGAGGAQFWKEEEPGTMKVAENRFREAQATGAKAVIAGCPFCKVMLGSAESAGKEGAPPIKDIAEVVAESLRRAKA